MRMEKLEVRGNRPISKYNSISYRRTVAPHTGAWIETSCPPGRQTAGQVAPHTGAWIETGL